MHHTHLPHLNEYITVFRGVFRALFSVGGKTVSINVCTESIKLQKESVPNINWSTTLGGAKYTLPPTLWGGSPFHTPLYISHSYRTVNTLVALIHFAHVSLCRQNCWQPNRSGILRWPRYASWRKNCKRCRCIIGKTGWSCHYYSGCCGGVKPQ